MSIKKLYKDVSGAALVYVIIAAAIVVLLGAATTATAYANLKTTQIQENSENNFYNADSVMNAIVSGLEFDMSDAYSIAYTHVVTQMDTYTSDSEMEGEFKTIFLTELRSKLGEEFKLEDGRDPGEQSDSVKVSYSISHLQEFVQDVLNDDSNKFSYSITAINGDNHIDTTTTGIILKNLHVTYEDDSGYFDEITTDIKLDIPTINLHIADISFPPVDAVVADYGMNVEFNTEVEINGNTYINEIYKDGLTKHEENDDPYSGKLKNGDVILLNTNSKLTVNTPDEIVAGGNIHADLLSELTIKGSTEANDGNKIWAENIDTGRESTINLSGQTYMLDDLEMNGPASNVKLAGEYYGYSSSPIDPDQSSAINVNGAHSTLDIYDLKILGIAGSSYLDSSSVPKFEGLTNSTDIQFGEAFSVKSNQIAYLVDDKEFDGNPLSKNYVAGFVSNPMSYEQYHTMLASNGDTLDNPENTFRDMLDTELSYKDSNGTPYTYRRFGATIVPTFSGTDKGTVYLYLNFDGKTSGEQSTQNASNYFTTVYNGNSLLSQRLRTYAAQYIKSLKLSEDTGLLIKQNYIDHSVALYSESTLPLPADKDDMLDGFNYHIGNLGNLEEHMNGIKVEYLGDGAFGSGKKYEVIYDKLIDEAQLKFFIEHCTAEHGAYADYHTNSEISLIENGVCLTGTNNAKAMIVNNRGKKAFELKGGEGILIATGDVIVTGDWVGSIIAGGTVTCSTQKSGNTSINITVDKMVVGSVAPLYFTYATGSGDASMSVINIFKEYQNVKVNNATNDEGINADMIANCISFTNWNKD